MTTISLITITETETIANSTIEAGVYLVSHPDDYSAGEIDAAAIVCDPDVVLHGRAEADSWIVWEHGNKADCMADPYVLRMADHDRESAAVEFAGDYYDEGETVLIAVAPVGNLDDWEEIEVTVAA